MALQAPYTGFRRERTWQFLTRTRGRIRRRNCLSASSILTAHEAVLTMKLIVRVLISFFWSALIVSGIGFVGFGVLMLADAVAASGGEVGAIVKQVYAVFGLVSLILGVAILGALTAIAFAP